MSVNVETVIAKYVSLRDKKAELKREMEEKTKEIDAALEKLEAYIRLQADEQGVTSFKTSSGTAFLTTVDAAYVADWDAVLKFIRDNQAYDMLEKRVNKTAVRAYIDAMKAVPAGVNYNTRLEVNVRRPSTKVD